MSVDRSPSEIVYIVWIGDILDLVLDSNSGELLTAHFFITTVGVSDYCFVEAFPNEKTNCFIKGTMDALIFDGVVPKILKPDNTKAAVIKYTRDALVLNTAYKDIQEHFGIVIVPVPPLKPKAKSTVENHVKYWGSHL